MMLQKVNIKCMAKMAKSTKYKTKLSVNLSRKVVAKSLYQHDFTFFLVLSVNLILHG